jgi:hypothetical protein
MPGNRKRIFKNSRAVFIVVFLMVAVSAAALYFGYDRLTGGRINNVSVNVPLINTTLTQPDGSELNVQTLFSVLIPKESRRYVPNAMLEEALALIMGGMDPEKLSGQGRVDYVNERATELLNSYLSEQNIDTQVIVTDMSTDNRAVLIDPTNRNDKVAEGLFQGLD